MHSGVRYILCVAVGREFESCSYELYQVVGRGCAVGPAAPIQVAVDSSAIVQLDARLLLGLPRDRETPPGFADPLEINLSAALEKLRAKNLFYEGSVESEEELEDPDVTESAEMPAQKDDDADVRGGSGEN